MYVCMYVYVAISAHFVRCNVCQGRAYGDAVMRVRPLAACGKQARACRDVPDDIREHLPEELSDLPADLIYATDLIVHESSRSEAVDRVAEAHNSLVAEIEVLHGTELLFHGHDGRMTRPGRLMMTMCASAGGRKMP